MGFFKVEKYKVAGENKLIGYKKELILAFEKQFCYVHLNKKYHI